MTITPGDLAELAAILEKLEYRLVTSNCQTLAEAGPGEVLTAANSFTLDLAPELQLIKRAKAILALPGAQDGPTEEDTQKAAVHRGIARGLR